jgi:hypothetical protein
MRIPTLFRSRLFHLMLMAGIAIASVVYNFHLRQRVDALESENAKLLKEAREQQETAQFHQDMAKRMVDFMLSNEEPKFKLKVK